jgi:hypothetical protein
VVLAWFVHLARDVRLHPTHDVFERLAIRTGAAAGFVGAVSFAWLRPGHLAVGAVAFAFGIGVVALAFARDVRRIGWLNRVHDGEVSGWSLAPALDYPREAAAVLPIAEVLPTNAVLVQTDGGDANGPYRAIGRPRAVAVLHLDAAVTCAPIRRRARAAALAAVGMLTVATVAFAHGRAEARARIRAVSMGSSGLHVEAIECTAVRRVFEHEIAKVPGVDRVLVETHTEDASIPAGSARAYVRPSMGHTLSAGLLRDVQAMARAIPCENKLAIEVREPEYKSHDIEAWIRVAPEDTADDALGHELRTSVWRVFSADTRDIVDNNRVDFGLNDLKLGGHIRYALTHDHDRVKSIVVKIDGETVEPILDPIEIPTLGVLTIRDARTGREL